MDMWEQMEQGYIFGNDTECGMCERDLPKEDMKTEIGCVWCDGNYHRSKKVIAMKKIEEIQNGTKRA